MARRPADVTMVVFNGNEEASLNYLQNRPSDRRAPRYSPWCASARPG